MMMSGLVGHVPPVTKISFPPESRKVAGMLKAATMCAYLHPPPKLYEVCDRADLNTYDDN